MAGNSNHAAAGRNLFMSSVTGFANTVALVVTFFGAPMLYQRSLGFVQSTTYQIYGAGWADFVSLAWFLICTSLVFFISRASIGTALIFGGLAIVTRFL
ncbi:hypothetical protein [Salipiger abyssi]|uniref:hypothetical protein n=1 Tax=Salipiger abyssi TaxID=1250539 RepID=UPI001A8E0D77|nr:hypothetical protein [Salipiger abyssi]MBN9890163.1 hypothetical protein [Salipiger abyssi]